jgi:hypothetical protein
VTLILQHPIRIGRCNAGSHLNRICSFCFGELQTRAKYFVTGILFDTRGI